MGQGCSRFNGVVLEFLYFSFFPSLGALTALFAKMERGGFRVSCSVNERTRQRKATRVVLLGKTKIRCEGLERRSVISSGLNIVFQHPPPQHTQSIHTHPSTASPTPLYLFLQTPILLFQLQHPPQTPNQIPFHSRHSSTFPVFPVLHTPHLKSPSFNLPRLRNSPQKYS